MKNYQQFLNTFFEQIAKTNLNVSSLNLDHIAYQASSTADYDQLKPDFIKLGEEVSEEIIGGRRVAIFKLLQPIKFRHYTIPAIELIEPKEGQDCKSEFQHAEFVLNQPFEQYIEEHPQITWDISSMNRAEFAHLKLNFDNGLTLKFLHQPVLEVVINKKD